MKSCVTAASLIVVGAALLLAPRTARAQRIGGATAVQAPGSIRGEVFDSLAMLPVSKAFVFIPGTALSTQSDQNGRFTLSDVPVGTQFVAFSSPALDSLGLSSLGGKVDVRSGETARVTIATPAFRTVWKSLCSWSERLGPDSGIVWGTVRDASTDVRLSNAPASFSWYDLRVDATKRFQFSEITKRTRTDSTGTYYACGLPYDIAISSEAAGVRAASGTVEYAIGDRRLHRVDLLVSTDMVLPEDAHAKNAADSAKMLRAHGQSVLKGMVRDLNGKPLSGVLVTLASVDTSVRTNDAGAFTMNALPAGTQAVQARQVGFSPATALVDLRPGKTTEINVEMPSSKALATFNVRADQVAGHDRAGFEARRRSGFGYALEAKNFANRPDISSALRDMPSVTVTRTSRGEVNVQLPGRAGGTCAANIYFDGMRADINQVTMYQTADFKAIEVYPRSMTVPAEFSTSLNNCGTILFWSKMSKW